MKFTPFIPLLALALASCSVSHPQQEDSAAALFPSWQVLSGTHFENWTGVQVSGPEATLDSSGEAVFRYPDGPRGWIKHGFRTRNDGAADWHECLGLKLDLNLADEGPEQVKAFIGTPGETDEAGMVQGTVTVRGPGWQTITLPWSAFAFDQANTSFLQNVKELRLAITPVSGGTGGKVLLRNVRVVEGDPLALKCAIRGKSAPSGQSVQYDLTVSNCTTVPQSVSLSLVKHGW
jgi:hypothetical protein